MRFSIQHETIYRYTMVATSTVQLLRLTPRNEAHQRVLHWHIEAPSKLLRQVDAYGNVTHTMSLSKPHQEIVLMASGTVELEALDNGRLVPEDGGIPFQAFGLSTELTQPDQALSNFAYASAPRGLRNATDALMLASAVADRVAYISGVTLVTSTAAQAFELGQGVCQDHAHVFLACCRVLNTPARYVSGYVHPGTADYAASHAWVDVWIDGQGWVSIDITNRQLTSDKHCRLAVARDYESAAPVRGVRTGGGEESLEVKVSFNQSGKLATKALTNPPFGANTMMNSPPTVTGVEQ